MDKEVIDLVDSLPRLTGETRTYVLNKLLENIGALPIRKTIVFDPDGTVLINGRKLELEQAVSLRESVHALKNNQARRIFNDQLRFLAVEFGVHQALTPEMMQFAKAALWLIQEEDKLIESIIANEE
jgi:hypothetical protein